MGCSSGNLHQPGEFDPFGPVCSYLLPATSSLAVVANLWDVTDRDIDRFSVQCLSQWNLFSFFSFPALSSQLVKEFVDRNQECSLAKAVQLSRNFCLLSNIVGAAPVVYGLPHLYLKKAVIQEPSF